MSASATRRCGSRRLHAPAPRPVRDAAGTRRALARAELRPGDRVQRRTRGPARRRPTAATDARELLEAVRATSPIPAMRSDGSTDAHADPAVPAAPGEPLQASAARRRTARHGRAVGPGLSRRHLGRQLRATLRETEVATRARYWAASGRAGGVEAEQRGAWRGAGAPAGLRPRRTGSSRATGRSNPADRPTPPAAGRG